jgi:hypothetical protein
MDRKLTGDIADLDALWRRLWSAHEGQQLSTGNWRDAPGRGITCRKPLERMFDAQRGLGDAVRLRCILAFTGDKQTHFFKYANSKAPAGPTSNAHRVFQLENELWNPVDRFYPGILELVNERRRAKKCRGALSFEQLFTWRYTGPEAVVRFMSRLEDDFISEDNPAFEAGDDNERLKMLSVLDKALDGTAVEGEHHGVNPLLINVHAEAMWEGLSAVAGEIRLRKDPHNRRIVIVPLVQRNRSPDGGVKILNFPEILTKLRTALLDDAAPFHDEEGIFTVIHQLRTNLVQDPAIIVFDGHYVGTNANYLTRRVADDHFDNLVTRLLDPPLASGDQPFDIARFALNRIVVTSNRPIPFSSQVLPIFSEVGAVHIALPAPSLANRAKIREKLLPGLLPETVEILSHDLFAGRRGDIEHLVDSCVRIARRFTPPETHLEHLFGKLSKEVDDRELLCLLVRQLIAHLLAHKPIWAEILSLIASVPDGLQLSTIHRFAKLSRNLAHNPKPAPLVVAAQSAGVLDDELDELHRAVPNLVGPYRSDSFATVDAGIAHPFEFGISAVEVAVRGPQDGTYEIAYPDIKAFICDYAREWMREPGAPKPDEPMTTMGSAPHADAWEMMHRLFAEDALQQQTVSLRYADRADLKTIRPWRRLLSAIYHGLLSMPLDAQGRMRQVDFGVRNFSTISEPWAFWRYLIAFQYRRMLEGPPHWSLSRYYGLDELKRAILVAFDRPWTLQFGEKPDWEGLASQQADNRGEQLRQDLVQSLVLAEIATGRLQTAEDRLRKEPQPKPDKNQELGALLRQASQLKREMDIDLLNGRDLSNRRYTMMREALLGQSVPAFDVLLVTAGKNISAIVRSGALAGNLAGSATDLLDHQASFGGLPDMSKLVDRLRIDNVPRLSMLSDLYFRMAEFHASRADFAAARLAGAPEVSHDLTMMRSFEDKTEQQVIDEFALSLAIYRFAEQLRLMAFELDPLGTEYFASAHPTRQSVRVALKLERYSRAQREKGSADELGLFAAYARRLADTLTRYQFRYPRERAGQIVLEATMLRHLAPEKQRAEWLHSARSHLALSETLVLGLGRKARVRMRLSFERLKVHRELVPFYEGAHRRALIEACQHDLLLLTQVSHELRLPVWAQLAALQRHKLRAET